MENDNLKKRLDELQVKYDQKFKEIEDDTKDEAGEIKDEGEGEGSVGGKFKIEITSKEERIVLSLPSVTVGTKKMKIKIPSVTMKTKKISWSVPKIRMVRKQIGVRPEVVCKNVRNSLGIMGKECKVRYKPIYADVPENVMDRKEIKMDFPEIKMLEQEFTIPSIEFKMMQQEIIFTVPQFTFKDVQVEAKKKSEELEEKTKDKVGEVQAAFEAESTQIISEETSKMFDIEIQKLIKEKENIDNLFKPLINDFKTKIKSLRSSGATDAAKDLERQLSELVNNYKEAVSQISKAIETLSKQREEIIDSL